MVNFHLDYENKQVRIVSKRDKTARLTVQPKQSRHVFIRMPGWTPAKSVRLTLGSKQLEPAWIDNFVMLAKDTFDEAPLSEPIVMQYELPTRTVIESTDGKDYEFTWRGDTVIGVNPNPGLLPFYPSS